jgi:hypothetical protein
LEQAPAVATAILGSSMVERDLDDMIVAKLKRKDDDTIALLSEQGGALSAFSTKIGLGYALGGIDSIDMFNLNIIRRVRNVFAHARKLVTFDHEVIRSELRKMKLRPGKRDQPSQCLVTAKGYIDFDARSAYLLLCGSLVMQLTIKRTNALNKAAKYLERKTATSQERWQKFTESSPLGAVFAQLPPEKIKALAVSLKESRRRRSGGPKH